MQLLVCKPAEDRLGLIVRLWNVTRDPVEARVRLPETTIGQLVRTSITEEDTDEKLPHDPHEFTVTIAAGEVVTLRVP